MKIILNLLGAFFVAILIWSFGSGLYSFITEPPKEDVVHEFHREPLDISYPSEGPFGTFDKAQLQRGLKVFREVCAACHGLERISFRNLEDLGYSEAQVKAIAAEAMVEDGPNDEGDMFTRTGRASDHFPSPYANDQAARYANNGALPPDLSLIVKARHHGADYIHAILTGYEPAPAGFQLNPGMHYNKYFGGHQIGMPQPLMDGQVAYADGTKSSVEQMSHDVSTFLAWASEPHQDERKRMGLKVILFLCFMSVIMYKVKKKIWKDVEH